MIDRADVVGTYTTLIAANGPQLHRPRIVVLDLDTNSALFTAGSVIIKRFSGMLTIARDATSVSWSLPGELMEQIGEKIGSLSRPDFPEIEDSLYLFCGVKLSRSCWVVGFDVSVSAISVITLTDGTPSKTEIRPLFTENPDETVLVFLALAEVLAECQTLRAEKWAKHQISSLWAALVNCEVVEGSGKSAYPKLIDFKPPTLLTILRASVEKFDRELLQMHTSRLRTGDWPLDHKTAKCLESAGYQKIYSGDDIPTAVRWELLLRELDLDPCWVAVKYNDGDYLAKLSATAKGLGWKQLRSS